MGNFFGFRRNTPRVSKPDMAIFQLKLQRDKIRVYQKSTEKQYADSKEVALKLFQNGMKDRALLVMKRRKCMQDIIRRTDEQLETLEQLVSDIEFTKAEASVVEGLKIGNQALKQLTSLMNIEDIQQMMEDTQEAAEKQNEISKILLESRERFDDNELLKELADITKDDKAETLVEELPNVPTDEVSTKLEDLPDVPEDEVSEKLVEDRPEQIAICQ